MAPLFPVVLLLMCVSRVSAAGSVQHFISSQLIPDRADFRVSLAPVTKSAANPLLSEGLSAYDMAWWNTYPSVIHRPDIGTNGTFQLWYNGFASCGGNKASTMCPATDYPNRTHVPATDRKISATFFAQSSDGLHFTRPSAEQVPWPTMSGSKSNNMVLDCGSSDPNRGVYYDKHETNVSRRYKAFGSFGAFNGASVGSSKLGTVVSADGIVWSDYTPTDEMRVTADTANNVIFDEDLDSYIAFTRNNVHSGAREYGGRREYRSVAKNYSGPWSQATEVARGEAGYELYSLLPWREPSWAAGVYFGIGSFYADNNSAEKVYCELMHSSTYGANWSRVAPHTPFIPLGTDGSFDDHTCYAARPFVDPVNPKDTLLYYSGGNGPHSGARSDYIARATTASNAFAGLSVDASVIPSKLVTADIQPQSNTLVLTVSTAPGTSIVVRLVDKSGNSVSSATIKHIGDAGVVSRRKLVLENAAASHGKLQFDVTGTATLYALEFL